jgi:hypothetical protein
MIETLRPLGVVQVYRSINVDLLGMRDAKGAF